MDEKKNLFRNTSSILNVRSQSLDTYLPSIEFHLVHIGKIPRRDRLPSIRKPFALDDVESRQNVTVTADTLESA